ncbi:DUF645 family protein [Massilia arenae]|uniref:DUF645 family protein n=1 Tax=Massilia arenae TaxID=2603288 RepID=A0A5C7FVF1_9BURK|nr:DUF645 family protein [Massilia arenae]
MSRPGARGELNLQRWVFWQLTHFSSQLLLNIEQLR